ncbi:clasp N terminal-domain-containing protein [Naematelia encephala]|uniref:Clasp N terminal-domain-containing protein n=1 Tax=Naematelia encephala TaxID=71784 RepID=A0A1Y2B279_9TREE|nr:clasp N terminal-domain-containing protein [Naematelia encephala]
MLSSGQPLTEDEVEGYLNKLKAAESDKKVDIVQLFGLKLEDASSLPETTLDALTLSTAPNLKTQHHLLSASTLTSFLPFYLQLLPINSSHHIRLAQTSLLPILVEKLNDPKERIHSAAANCIAILGRRCYAAEPVPLIVAGKGKEEESLVGYWERSVKEALAGKGWRGKVEGMKMLLRMRGDDQTSKDGTARLPLKPWLASLVDLLEDGDGNVRDTARETVVALLSPASTPPAARSELKKLLSQQNVRKTIADGIIARVFGGGSAPQRSATPADETTPASLEDVPVLNSAATLAADEVDVVYIANAKDLESEFAKMIPHFQGKETEHNWLPREKSIIRIRGMLRGQASKQYLEAFVAGLKVGIMEGLSKTLLSLRTTLAQQSCAAVQELVEYLGPAFDPFVDHLLPILGKMAGFTKKIIAEKSQRIMSAIIIHTSCHPKTFISHISAGIADKNIQTRHHCTNHLKTYLDIHGSKSKHVIDNTPGLIEQLDGSLKRSLGDVNPQVRELARAAFWSYHLVWPTRAQAIMETLDGIAKKQLAKANPREPNSESLQLQSQPGPPQAKRTSSAMSHMLAERRKAKAAELAAGRAAQDSPRTVSGPAPDSPSLGSSQPRSTSVSGFPIPRRAVPSTGVTSPKDSSPGGSPESSRVTPKTKNGTTTQQELSQRPRSSSLNRDIYESSSSSRGSPTSRSTPLRQTSTVPPGIRSPASTSSTSGPHPLRTPTLQRAPLPATSSSQPVGLGVYQPGETHESHSKDFLTPSRVPLPSTPGQSVVEDAMRAQAAQAESAAAQLLDFTETEQSTPRTPLRATNGNGHQKYTPGMLKTPVSNFLSVSTPGGSGRGGGWLDSPRQQEMTPSMLDKLKTRRFERVWWARQARIREAATPLKSAVNGSVSSVLDDVEALEAGQPSVHNLQKLLLFSSSHPVSSAVDDHEDDAVDRRIWEESRLFERIFDGLMGYFVPHRSQEDLQVALCVLWELIQYQWPLFDSHEVALVDALFRLRATKSAVVHECTRSLVSLLTEASDPLYLLSVIRGALDRFLAANLAESDRVRVSGFGFGLISLGMCIVRLPKEVVLVEGRRLESLVMQALSSPNVPTRQAASILVLGIQCQVCDSQLTLSLFPSLEEKDKNLMVYLFARNGIADDVKSRNGNGTGPGLGMGTGAGVGVLGNGTGTGTESDGVQEEKRRDKVIGEMLGELSRSEKQMDVGEDE